MAIERLSAPAPEEELRSAGLHPDPWSVGPGTVFAAHRHPRTKRLFVVGGSIRFDVAEGAVELTTGQGIRLPAGTEHAAIAGPGGVRCLEAFEPS